jgi:hypothetical protein
MEFESRVCGIPCIIEAEVSGSSANYGDASDHDCWGYTEIESWKVLDRNGRPAPWLERKLNAKEINRIENEIYSRA